MVAKKVYVQNDHLRDTDVQQHTVIAFCIVYYLNYPQESRVRIGIRK